MPGTKRPTHQRSTNKRLGKRTNMELLLAAGILNAKYMSDRDKRIVNEKMTTVEINALIKAKIKVGGGPLMPKAPGGGCGF